jgi:GrpB-like predicted nucleotidyltransferase (UPF0157 family)
MSRAVVRLFPHDQAWVYQAVQEAERLRAATLGTLQAVHHIGSTAVAGLAAKPIIDLLAVVAALDALDEARSSFEALGYDWKGEYGLVGRRYCRLDDPVSGERRIHLHCYQANDSALARHLAFRDLLRSQAHIAAAYELQKRRCTELHPSNSRAYTACKGERIRRRDLAREWRALNRRLALLLLGPAKSQVTCA